jgi:Mesyanzhinovviridae DNA primase
VRTFRDGRNPEYVEYLINWMAYAVQHPDRQGEVAVVLRGKEGTGKGVAAKEFGRLLGAQFRHIVHAKHLTGHFNAHLQQCSVLFADEAFFAGDRSHESILKALITEETLLIEPKGIDPFPVRNCVHLIISSNSDWVIPAGADARRYFVLNVGDAHMQDHEYFAAIATQMDNGGREALLDFLLKRDLSNFNVRLVPQTKALAEQKQHTRRGVDRLVEIIARDGRLPAARPGFPDMAITSGEEKREGFYALARSLVPDLKHDSSIVTGNKLKEEWGCVAWKSGYHRGLRFVPLPSLREKFDQRHGKQDWLVTGGEVVEWAEQGLSEE